MAYAVVESGGKQYVARSGETIDVDRLSLKEGDKVTFDNVLLIAGSGAALVGSPHVEGAKVLGHVVEEFKGPKVVVFKYKPKIRYRKRQGHRQWYTRVAIDDVVAPGSARKTAKKAEAEEAEPATKVAPSPKAKQAPKPKAPAKKAAEKADKPKPATKAAPKAKKTTTKAKKPSTSTKKASGTSKDKKAE
jgi:large subunit ribosomal protein L21